MTEREFYSISEPKMSHYLKNLKCAITQGSMSYFIYSLDYVDVPAESATIRKGTNYQVKAIPKTPLNTIFILRNFKDCILRKIVLT